MRSSVHAVPLRPTKVVALLAAALVLGAACKKNEPPRPGAVPSSAGSLGSPPPPLDGALRLVTPTAFELVASPGGATLIVAALGEGSVQTIELDAQGTPLGPATTALALEGKAVDVSDLAAVWVQKRLALSWVERAGAAGRVRAAWAKDHDEQRVVPGRIVELGAAWLGPRTARGNIAVAARRDEALVFARGEATPCGDPAQQNCFGFSFHALRPEGGAERTGLPLVVPVPCTDDSTALAVVGRRFHYGVCTETGKTPVTTLFTIEHEPEYARADRLLEGCRPKGTLLFGGAVWLIGDCEGNRRAVRVAGRTEPLEFLDLRVTRFECRAGEARVRAPGLELALDEPRDRLEGILPPDIAPAGSRASWSGRALVVAAATGDALALTRFACAGDRVQRDPIGITRRRGD